MLEMMLMAGGYQVVEFHDGQQVLHYLQQHTPELLIADLATPGVDGLGLCERVKNVARLRHLPVLIIVPDEELRTLQALRWVRADDHLLWPAARPLLINKVRALLKPG